MIVQEEQESTELQQIEEVDSSCPFCGSQEPGILSKEASFLTYIVVMVSLCLFGLLTIIILPLLVQSSKTIVKRCIDCQEVIEQKELFSFPSLKDEVMNFRCGNCSLIISRKYALIFILLFCIIWGVIYSLSPPSQSTSLSDEFYSEENPSWISFVQDCGRNQVLSNEMKAKNIFQHKSNYFNCFSLFLDIIRKQQPGKVFSWPTENINMLTQMNPTDAGIQYPDLRLDLSRSMVDSQRELINSLQFEDMINFTARFAQLGDESVPNIFELLSFTKLEQKTPLNSVSTVDGSNQSKNLRKPNSV